MTNLKKRITLGFCLLFLVTFVTACSKGSDQTKSTSDNSQASSTVYGKVTKIDGDKITLSLGDMSQGGPNSGDQKSGKSDGAAPSGFPQGGPNDGNQKGDKSGGAVPSGMPKGGPNGGDQKGSKSDGAVPSGMPKGGPNGGQPGGMGGAFVENGETLVITVDDESLIKIQSGNQETAGSLEDITVNSILTLNYSNDKEISEIIVQSMDNAPKPDTKGDNSSNKQVSSAKQE